MAGFDPGFGKKSVKWQDFHANTPSRENFQPRMNAD
jgi:hypothetical protein